MGQPRRVAVLGGGGFIGRHLTAELRRAGYTVRSVDVNGRADVTLDLTDRESARVAVVGCDWVCHLAADMGGVGYFHGPADWGAAVTNGRMTANVLDACVTEGVHRLLYTSSACAYPIELQGHDPAVGERAHRLREVELGHGTPDQLYGAEKLHGARLVAGAPLDGRVAVLHTVYGPGQEATGPRAKFPPAVAYKALQAAETGSPLELWGDGQQRRSYLAVGDAVVMLRTVLERDMAPDFVNVGAEGAVTCDDVARLCLDLVGAPDLPIVHNPAMPSGVRARDCSLDRWWKWFGDPPDHGLRAGFASLIDSLRRA